MSAACIKHPCWLAINAVGPICAVAASVAPAPVAYSPCAADMHHEILHVRDVQMTKQQAGATDPNLLLTLHLTPVNALVVTHTRPPANERAYGMRPYLLGAMLFCLDQVKAFALHEPEHVEKAIVARWCEALLQAQPFNEVWRNGNNVRCSAAAQPLHKQCS